MSRANFIQALILKDRKDQEKEEKKDKEEKESSSDTSFSSSDLSNCSLYQQSDESQNDAKKNDM